MLPRDIWRITDETCERDRKMALLPEHILEDLGVKQPSGLLKVGISLLKKIIRLRAYYYI